MIADYMLVAFLLFIMHIMFDNWPLCMIITMIMWLVFAIKIGNQRELCLEDLMPREQQV
jgi:hypothetical protein